MITTKDTSMLMSKSSLLIIGNKAITKKPIQAKNANRLIMILSLGEDGKEISNFCHT